MWPDGGISPFRSEKDTNWEGAVRVPCFARWPGVIKPGTIINGLFSAEDWLPTLVAAAGDPNIKEKLLKGHTAGSEDLQGPPRRLQPGTGAQGRGEGIAAPGVRLLR